MKKVSRFTTDVLLTGLVGILCIIALVMIGKVASADPFSNVKVGMSQGGDQMYVKSQGSILIQSGAQVIVSANGNINVRSVSMFQLPMAFANVGIASSSAQVRIPFDATISAIKCAADTQLINGTTAIYAKIQGTVMTLGSVGITSTAAAYTNFTITPTTATVKNGSTVSVEFDGTTTADAAAVCTIILNP